MAPVRKRAALILCFHVQALQFSVKKNQPWVFNLSPFHLMHCQITWSFLPYQWIFLAGERILSEILHECRVTAGGSSNISLMSCSLAVAISPKLQYLALNCTRSEPEGFFFFSCRQEQVVWLINQDGTNGEIKLVSKMYRTGIRILTFVQLFREEMQGIWSKIFKEWTHCHLIALHCSLIYFWCWLDWWWNVLLWIELADSRAQ